MLAVASVIVVVLVSLLITRIASVALTLTGMSRESARFQARSALSGVGFTTSEAESIVNHPARRRIVMMLMLAGSAGIVTVVGTLVLSFGNADASQRTLRVGVLVGALALLWLVARSSRVDRLLSRIIARGLDRWTDLEGRDHGALLQLAGDFAVMELAVHDSDWITGGTLEDLRLRDEEVVVLGVVRPDGTYVGVPSFATRIAPGDSVVLYGRTERIAELDDRPLGPDGDARHRTSAAGRSAVTTGAAG